MLKAGRCRAASKACSTRLGEAVEGSDPSREVIQTGEVFEVAAVATVQDVTEVVVDVLLEGSEAVSCRAVLMFHLAVVLESGHVIGRGLDAQDESELVIDLDRGLAKRCLTQVPSIRVAN